MSARPDYKRLSDEDMDLLISRYLDGDLNPDEAGELERLVATDPRARERHAATAALVEDLKQLPTPEPPFALATRVSSNVLERSNGLGSVWHRVGFYPPPGLAVAGAGVLVLTLVAGYYFSGLGGAREETTIAQRESAPQEGPVRVFLAEEQNAPRAEAKKAPDGAGVAADAAGMKAPDGAGVAADAAGMKAPDAPRPTASAELGRTNEEAPALRAQGELDSEVGKDDDAGASARKRENLQRQLAKPAPATIGEDPEAGTLADARTGRHGATAPAPSGKEQRTETRADERAAPQQIAQALPPAPAAAPAAPAPVAEGFAPEPPASRDAAGSRAESDRTAAKLRAAGPGPARAQKPETSVTLVAGRGWKLSSPVGQRIVTSSVNARYRLTLDADGRVVSATLLSAGPSRRDVERLLSGLTFERVAGERETREIEVQVSSY